MLAPTAGFTRCATHARRRLQHVERNRQQSGVGIEIEESAIPVREAVRGACELLGLDPLYVANEGKLIAHGGRRRADAVLAAMRGHPLGAMRPIGSITAAHPGMVTMRTLLGPSRIVDMLSGDQLPRIC